MTRPRRGDDQAVDPAGEDQPRECLVRLLLVVVVGEEHREVALPQRLPDRQGRIGVDDARCDRRRSTRRARDVDEPARAAGGKALPGATSA
jgi:hypothetical protein